MRIHQNILFAAGVFALFCGIYVYGRDSYRQENCVLFLGHWFNRPGLPASPFCPGYQEIKP